MSSKILPWFNRVEIYEVVKEAISKKELKSFLSLFSPLYNDFYLSIEEIVELDRSKYLKHSILTSVFSECFRKEDIFFLKLVERIYTLSICNTEQALTDLEQLSSIFDLVSNNNES